MDADDSGPGRPEPGEAGYRTVVGALADIFSSLLDVQLRTIVTTQLTPVIYVFLVFSVAFLNLYFAVQAFDRSQAFGLFWTVIVMPVMFIAGVIAVRVALEVIICIFRIVMHMEALAEQLHTLRGQTEVIVEDLPRIQFWRTRKRPEPRKGTAP